MGKKELWRWLCTTLVVTQIPRTAQESQDKSWEIDLLNLASLDTTDVGSLAFPFLLCSKSLWYKHCHKTFQLCIWKILAILNNFASSLLPKNPTQICLVRCDATHGETRHGLLHFHIAASPSGFTNNFYLLHIYPPRKVEKLFLKK